MSPTFEHAFVWLITGIFPTSWPVPYRGTPWSCYNYWSGSLDAPQNSLIKARDGSGHCKHSWSADSSPNPLLPPFTLAHFQPSLPTIGPLCILNVPACAEDPLFEALTVNPLSVREQFFGGTYGLPFI